VLPASESATTTVTVPLAVPLAVPGPVALEVTLHRHHQLAASLAVSPAGRRLPLALSVGAAAPGRGRSSAAP
jgi:hypothetical protein